MKTKTTKSKTIKVKVMKEGWPTSSVSPDDIKFPPTANFTDTHCAAPAAAAARKSMRRRLSTPALCVSPVYSRQDLTSFTLYIVQQQKPKFCSPGCSISERTLLTRRIYGGNS